MLTATHAHDAGRRPENAQRWLNLLRGIPLRLLLAGLVVVAVCVSDEARRATFWQSSLSFAIEALPFLLLSAFFASLLARFPTLAARLWTRRPVRATCASVALSFSMPLCECGTPPVVRQAARQGVPVVALLTFLLAAPVVNPITLFVTWLAFQGDWRFVAGRAALGIAVALIIALLCSLHPDSASLLRTADDDDHDHGSDFGTHVVTEFLQTVAAAFPGLLLAAAIRTVITPDVWLSLGQGAVMSALILMLLASLLAICSSVDAYVALSFAGLFPTGAILAFLVFGPIINVKTVPLLHRILRWRTIGLVALISFQIIVLVAAVINYRLV